MFRKKLTRREFNKVGTKALLWLGASLWSGSNSFASAENSSQQMHEARFYRKLNANRVQCQLCYRKCVVKSGHRGFCRNRENRDGTYYTVVYGKPSALQVDPIEKEPCYHMWPGTRIFCTGTASCNNRCQFCHNWHLSQRSLEELTYYEAQPEDIVNGAEYFRCESLSFTYNEPTVFYEYMYDIAKLGKERGLGVLYHTNGLINKAPLLALLEHMDAVTVDLKAFTEKFYVQSCAGELKPLLDTLVLLKEIGIWLELVVLIIPTLNDSPDETKQMAEWVVKHLGPDVPMHFTRFHPTYRITNLPRTPVAMERCTSGGNGSVSSCSARPEPKRSRYQSKPTFGACGSRGTGPTRSRVFNLSSACRYSARTTGPRLHSSRSLSLMASQLGRSTTMNC